MWYEMQDCMLELFTPSVTFFVWSSGGLVFPPMLGRKLGLSCDIGWLLWIVILTPMGKMSLTRATVRRLHFRCLCTYKVCVSLPLIHGDKQWTLL